MAQIVIPIPQPVQAPASAPAAGSQNQNQNSAAANQGSQTMSQASAVPQLGDLMAIFSANAAQAAQTQAAVSDQIRNQAAYAMQTDNRLVTGAVAAQIAAAGEPDAFAGLNSGVRVPITLDQPGTYPANQKVGP